MYTQPQGTQPFLLMHGYEARLPVDIIFGSGSKEKHSLCDYVTEVQDRLEATFQKVRDKTGQEQKRQKTLRQEDPWKST